MRMSRLFSQTLRDVPAEADIPSHQLLLRAGLGLEPQGDNLIVDPALPLRFGHLQILDLPGPWKKMDAFGRGRVDTDRLTARALGGK